MQKRKHEEENDSAITRKRDSRFKCSDLIVLGLPFKTNEETVREYFSTYGELLLVQVSFLKFISYDAFLNAVTVIFDFGRS